MFKYGFAEQIFSKFCKLSFHPVQLYRAAKYFCIVALNTYIDGCLRRNFIPGNIKARPECCTSFIYFSLWQVQRVLAFNVPGTHIIADSITTDRPLRINEQCKFWL